MCWNLKYRSKAFLSHSSSIIFRQKKKQPWILSIIQVLQVIMSRKRSVIRHTEVHPSFICYTDSHEITILSQLFMLKFCHIWMQDKNVILLNLLFHGYEEMRFVEDTITRKEHAEVEMSIWQEKRMLSFLWYHFCTSIFILALLFLGKTQE